MGIKRPLEPFKTRCAVELKTGQWVLIPMIIAETGGEYFQPAEVRFATPHNTFHHAVFVKFGKDSQCGIYKEV